MSWEAAPQRWSHELIIGYTYRPLSTLTLVDAAGTAYDLTDTAFTLEIRTAVHGGTLVLAPTVSIISAVDGQLSWSADAADTDDLTPGTYPYALTAVWADGTSGVILEGDVTIRRTVGA